MANIKVPTLEDAKNMVVSRLPKSEPERSDDEATGAKAAAPKPWEPQPVQSPAITNSAIPGSPAQSEIKIGTAPLPPGILGTSIGTIGTAATQMPAPVPTVKPSPIAGINGTNPGSIAGVPTGMPTIAPNPLSTPLPSELNSIPGAGQITASPNLAPAAVRPRMDNPVTALPVAPAKIATAPKTKPVVIKPVQLRKATTTAPKTPKPKVGATPASIPTVRPEITMAPDLSAANSGILSSQQVPFPAPEIAVAERVNPSPLPQFGLPKPVKVKPKTKPAIAKFRSNKLKPPAAKPKPAAPVLTQVPAPEIAPDSSFGTANPSPIPNDIQGAGPQNPPVIAEPPIQSKVGSNPGKDPFDSPSLQETKRYFQSKWKADPTQFSTLQYVVQINGKNGVVRSVSPQSEADASYLKKTGLIKPGQKLLSPAAIGSPDQRIRVLLQPDGNVDTLIEP